LKDEALVRTLWRTRFGRGDGPVVRQATEWMSATLSTTNPTWTDLKSNPGLSGESPATNRLSHGTAQEHSYWFFSVPEE
jgi:hypothetical protein